MTSRHGLQTVHTGANPVLDIVFVHGLFGHPRETWTSHKVEREAEQSSAPPVNLEPAQDSGARQAKRRRLWGFWKTEVVQTDVKTGGSQSSMTDQSEAGNNDESNWSGVYRDCESVFWPADLLPTVLPQSRIFTWGYDVDINHLFSSASQATVFQHAETLLSALADERSSPQERARSLVFVAHSLGGIVVKDMLNASRNEQHEYLNEILPSTYGIVFLGTPHRGSATASLGTIAQGITKAFLKSPNTSVLRDLKVNSQTLDRIGRGFSQILVKQPIKVHSFREELPTNGVMIVDSFSSAIEHGLEIRGLIPADHRRMTKFSGLLDQGFKRVSAVLIRWAREIVETREKSQAPYEETAFEGPPFMVPFERDPDFTGREEILAKVEKGFRSRRRSALVGLGGVGKSQIAIEYAYRLRDSSPSTTILWAHGGDQERFRESYRTIADALKLPGRGDRDTDTLALVKRWLCSAESGSWLLIVDNVDDLTVFTERITDARKSGNGRPHVMASLSSYIPYYKTGSILITSRSRSAALQLTTEGTCLIDVSSMSETEATKLLHLKLPEDGSSIEHFEALAAGMEYLPLAITQAAAYISMGSTVSGYLSLFRNGEPSQLELLQKEFKDIRRDEQIPNYAVLFTWTTSFELIQARNPSAADLLFFMSVLHRQGIPESLLSKVIEDAHNLNDNLMALKEYSLISTRIDNKSYDIHHFVQLATRLRLDRNGLAQKYRSQALAGLAEAFPKEQHDTQSLGLGKELLPHANEVGRFEFHGHGDLSKQGFLLHSLGIFLDRIGLPFQSMASLEQAVSIRTGLFGHLDKRTIYSQRALSSSLLHCGLFEASEEITQRIVKLVEPEIRWSTDVSDQIFWAECVSQLALSLRCTGKYKEAKDLVRSALRIKEVVLGADHEETLHGVWLLGVLLLGQDKLDEAEFHLRRVLRAYVERNGPSHVNAMRCYRDLGSLLARKGAYVEAEEAYSKALVGTTAILTEKHPETLEIAAEVIFLRYRYGWTTYSEILTELERLSLTAIQVMGIDHPFVLRAMYIKSYVKCTQGEFEEALSIGRELLNARERVLGPNHPYTLLSLHHLAWIMYNQRDFEQAEDVCERALAAKEINPGLEDLNTLGTMRLRLMIVRAQNRHERVLQLKDQLLERHESVLGPEHAKVLWILTEVGGSLNRLGRFAEAEQQLRRVYNSYQRASDVNDSDFRKMHHRLETALAHQSKFGEMEEVSRVCLSRQVGKLGEQHKSTVEYRIDLAVALGGLQRFAEASDVGLHIVAIVEREKGTGDPYTCSALKAWLSVVGKDSSFRASTIKLLLRWREELAQVHHKDACDALVMIARVFEGKKSQHAEESYSTALKLKEKLYGPDAVEINQLKLEIGQYVSRQGRYFEATAILKQCVQYFEGSLGLQDELTLDAYEDLALALSACGVADEAEVYARKALSGLSKVFGKSATKTLGCQNSLGLILKCTGKYIESEEVLRQSLAHFEAPSKREDGEISRSQMLLAMTLGALGKCEEAEQLAQAAFNGDSANFGLEHRYTFEDLSVLARMLRLQGKYSEAEKLAQQALDGQFQVLREQHPKALTTKFELARVYRAQGRKGDALKTAREVFEGRNEILGRQHPLTIEVGRFLENEVEASEAPATPPAQP